MHTKASLGLLLCLPLLACSAAARAGGPTTEAEVHVNIAVQPIASLRFTTANLLALVVPPSKSTVNTSGSVGFIVSGNARATLTAAPDQFIDIPGADNGWMGKAVLAGGAIGYQIQLTFPSNGVPGSPKSIATLPLFDAESTVPPLAVPLPLTGGQRPGTIDLLASEDWTADGALPLPGVYTGQIILTLTADNL